MGSEAPRHRHSEPWEEHADWWQRGFTEGADAEYTDQIIPLVCELIAGRDKVIDIGTGEGQIARALLQQGDADTVFGVDPAGGQIREATRRGGATFLCATAASLPFVDRAFDAAIACLVYEHIEQIDAAIEETFRVLRPGGRFALLLNHPLLQTPGSGWVDDQWLDPPEAYWRVGPYLSEVSSVEEVEKGVFIPFVHRPLGRYVNALIDTGFVLGRMLEPAPPERFLQRAPEYRQAAAIPRLLALVADRPNT